MSALYWLVQLLVEEELARLVSGKHTSSVEGEGGWEALFGIFDANTSGFCWMAIWAGMSVLSCWTRVTGTGASAWVGNWASRGRDGDSANLLGHWVGLEGSCATLQLVATCARQRLTGLRNGEF